MPGHTFIWGNERGDRLKAVGKVQDFGTSKWEQRQEMSDNPGAQDESLPNWHHYSQQVDGLSGGGGGRIIAQMTRLLS